MDAHKLRDLIDQYLLGTISPEDKASLEKSMREDSGVREKVQESQQAFNVLLAARNRQLRQKLREIDKNDRGQARFLFRKIIPWLAVIMFLLCGWFWVSIYFSYPCLALRYFEQSNISEVTHDPLTNIRFEANESFRKRAYEKAILLYGDWIQSADGQDIYQAKWNILLAQLALEGRNTTWNENMIAFIQEAPEPLAGPARKLLAQMDSALYRLFLHRFRGGLSALKPPLI